MSELIRSKSRAKDLINKFKSREQETGIEQALMYLKLKEHNCSTTSALIFAKKKEKNIDGTLEKDGPSNCRMLTPIKPDGIIVNGWLKGEKLKYQGTTSFNQFLRHTSASLSTKINKVNKQSRIIEEQERKERSQSAFLIDHRKNAKENIEKIASLKDNVMKEREINPFIFKFNGFELPQMTKIFSQEISKGDSNGLIIKTGVFDNCINDSQVEYVPVDENSFGKSTKNIRNTVETTFEDKRNEILRYKKLVEDTKISEQEDNLWTKTEVEEKKKMAKTFNSIRSFSKTNKGSKIVRSKSAMGLKEIKAFEDKISELIKKELLTPFTNSKLDYHSFKQEKKRVKLTL